MTLLASSLSCWNGKIPRTLTWYWQKSDDEFEVAFEKVLHKAIDRLETNSKNYKQLQENGLTSTLAGFLSCPGLSTHCETNSNGHVDITIEAILSSPPRKKLGEAKMYGGYKVHVGGLEQLLSYMTGRETRGIVIDYVRQKDIAGKMKTIRDEMDKIGPHDQVGVTDDHSLQWSFVSRHKHSCGDELDVWHVSVNMNVNFS